MNKKYDDLVKKISILEADLNEKKEILSRAEKIMSQSENKFNNLWEDFKKKMLAGQGSEADTIQKKMDELAAETRKNMALKEALGPKIEELEKSLVTLIHDKNAVFTKQAKKWLRVEIATYDDLAAKTLNTVKRLFVCYGFLKDIGSGQAGIDQIGEAFHYLYSIQLPTIEHFNREIYAGDGSNKRQINNPQKTEVQAVLEEIITGKRR